MELQKMNFKNDELDVKINSYIDKENEIWFRGKDIASILGYVDTKQAIRKHVDDEDKKTIKVEKSKTFAKTPKSRGVETTTLLKNNKQTYNCVFINESGFYSLILSSKSPSAKKFKRWVTSEVLPSIRKKGYYKSKSNDVIETETDLHCKVVSFIREKYPNALMIAGLGENQKTEAERIESWRKGYMSGQCDLMLMNPTRKYSSLCIEFKDPKGNNHLSEKQIEMKGKYMLNKCKYISSRSATDITFEIVKYMDESDAYIKRRLSRR